MMHFAQHYCHEGAVPAILFRTSGLRGYPCESAIPFASGHGCLYSFSSSLQGQTIPEQSRRLPDWWGRGLKSGSHGFLSWPFGCHKWHPSVEFSHVPSAPSPTSWINLLLLWPRWLHASGTRSIYGHAYTHLLIIGNVFTADGVGQVFCCLPYYHVRQLHCGAVVPMNITPYVQFEYLGKSWWWGESYFFSVIFFDIFNQLDHQAWGRSLL